MGIPFLAIKTLVGGEGEDGGGIYIGMVSTAFPTSRPNGDNLVLGDYVVPDGSKELPFTIEGITFSNRKDRAVYLGNSSGQNLWILNATAYQATNEIPSKSPKLESITEKGNTQYDINVNAVNALLETVSSWQSSRSYKKGKLCYSDGAVWESLQDFNEGKNPSENSDFWKRLTPYRFLFKQEKEANEWKICHGLRIQFPFLQAVIDGSLVGGLDVNYTDNDNLTINFNNAVKGVAIIF